MNQLLDELNQKDTDILACLQQRAMVRQVAIPVEKVGRYEFLSLWARQSASLSDYEYMNIPFGKSCYPGACKRWRYSAFER
jgi:hypothetical protein